MKLRKCIIDQQHLSEWNGSGDESHGQKVITAMSCHAKMFRQSCECRKLFELSDSAPLNSTSRQTNEIKFPVSFKLKRAVGFLGSSVCWFSSAFGSSREIILDETRLRQHLVMQLYIK